MKSQVEIRKDIINSYKSHYGEMTKGIDKRIGYLKAMAIINGLLSLICIIYVIAVFLNFKILTNSSSGLLPLLSVSFFIRLPQTLFELKLKKHYKSLKINFLPNNIERYNKELISIIKKLNGTGPQKLLIIILMFAIILLSIFLMTSDDNLIIWSYLKFILILFYAIIIWYYYTNNKELSNNIKAYNSLS